MRENEIIHLARHGRFMGQPIDGIIEETHISWVIVGRKWAFKIKKPVKLPFLDFSSLALRKKFCYRELELNQRFSKIYQRVAPIVKSGRDFKVGGKGTLIDYAVMMNRLDQSRKMDVLLRSATVYRKQIKSLSNIIARFHLRSDRLYSRFSLEKAINTFNAIHSIKNIVTNNLGRNYSRLISRWEEWSDAFLRRHENRFQQRVDRGFKRDVHGDLHSGNIFLYDPPILFDCIEFNDDFRQIDVLYEVAFLCMELELFGRRSLSALLLQQYLNRFPCLETEEDKKIFNYYKCLRANVRAQVYALQLRQTRNLEERMHQKATLKKYLDLIKVYVRPTRAKTQLRLD